MITSACPQGDTEPQKNEVAEISEFLKETENMGEENKEEGEKEEDGDDPLDKEEDSKTETPSKQVWVTNSFLLIVQQQTI